MKWLPYVPATDGNNQGLNFSITEQNNPKDNEYNSLSSAVDAILRIQEKVNLTMLDQEESERQNMADDEGKICVHIVVIDILIISEIPQKTYEFIIFIYI